MGATLNRACCGLLAATVAVSGCTAESAKITTTHSVLAVVDEIIAADNRGDRQAVIALYTDDAVLLPPGEPPVVGRQLIEERYRQIFDEVQLSLESSVESQRVASDWAVARGTISGGTTLKSDGSRRDVDDKFVMILERAPTRGWVIAELIWSANSTPSPGDAAPAIGR